MISNKQSTTTPEKSNEQLYFDFAELIYDIYMDSQIIEEAENFELTKSQKLEYEL